MRDFGMVLGVGEQGGGVGAQEGQVDHQRGVGEVVDRFTAVISGMIEADPELLAMFPDRRALVEHDHVLGEHLRMVLGRTADPGRATEIGHAHLGAGVRPSTYLLAYNQVFPCLHAVPAQELPALPAMRSRWLADACSTLDAYHEVLLGVWARERTALHSDVARLGEEATTDDLTGVLNRRGFISSVQASRRAGCLMVLDLDHFKAYNDRAGHPAGDTVLRTVGHTLTALSRVGDAAGRLGGDEFAVWLEGGSRAGALSVLQRVRSALPAGVGVCGGTVDCAGGAHDFARLYEVADAALYEQKRARPDTDRPAATHR